MEIKIIGSQCSNGMKLYKIVSRAVEDLGEDIAILRLEEEKAMKQYGVKNAPGLVINGELVSEGRVLTSREIGKLLA